MKIEVDVRDMAYVLQALRDWITGIEVELEKSGSSEHFNEEFLMKVEMTQERLMGAYRKAYDPNTNMIPPELIDRERNN